MRTSNASGRGGSDGDRAGYPWSRPAGQLEDDLDDLMTSLDQNHRASETTLIGCSSGGGFALRIAGGHLGSSFSRFILLAPFLRYDNTSETIRGSYSTGPAALAVLH